jgi:hypothetical protein
VKFLLDENLSPEQAIGLRRRGYDAVAPAEVGLSGHADETVRTFAVESGRILLTLDADFGKHIARHAPRFRASGYALWQAAAQTGADPNKSVSYDHIVRVSEGGSGDQTNVQMVHPYCNTGYKN